MTKIYLSKTIVKALSNLDEALDAINLIESKIHDASDTETKTILIQVLKNVISMLEESRNLLKGGKQGAKDEKD